MNAYCRTENVIGDFKEFILVHNKTEQYRCDLIYFRLALTLLSVLITSTSATEFHNAEYIQQHLISGSPFQ